jgi:formamidopyrimidine-DNA glycosylase
MPELPEMENYRQLLSQRILHKRIDEVEINREKSINVPVADFLEAVRGHSFIAIERRAKHLLFGLDSGNVLLLHLMLGGSVFYGDNPPDRTAQIVIHFRDSQLYFIGLRLGYLHLHSRPEVERLLAKLGPEPLAPSLSLPQFHQLLRRRSTTLKVTLVDQSFLSGIGNCYSDEICFMAGLLPTRRSGSLAEGEVERLYQAMHSVLNEAVRYGGYMDTPLFPGDTLTGGFDERCRVYDREGEPCVQCGTPITKQMVSSKKCFYCTHCQK